MTIVNRFRILVLFVSFIQLNANKATIDLLYMDRICGSDAITLDGNIKPGVNVRLTSNAKYQPNFSCTIKFRAAQAVQRFVVTVEKLDIVDCPGDVLRIFDGTKLLNTDIKQQCGSTAPFYFTTSTTQLSITFTSNAAIESSGFNIAVALHFPAVTTCPQSLGLLQCANKNCISKTLQCDKHNHCGDNTDELSCSLIG